MLQFQGGQPPAAAHQEAVGELYRTMTRQADMLAFVDAFRALMIVILLMTPLVLFMKGQPPGARGGHGAA